MPDENLDNKNQSRKGGARPGAGRKKGSRNKATIQAKRALSELAQEHTQTALDALVMVARQGESESARVAAAVAILDRGYGRPVQAVEATGAEGGPIQFEEVSARERIAGRIARAAARAGAAVDPGEPDGS
jgi:hypothetical protein